MSTLHAQHDLSRVASASELRSNADQRDVVTRGIATLCELGVMPAVEYLKSNGVGPKVIERVVLEPERRRASA
ncbi:hypothetical protein AB2N08_03950 [Massilia aurea]|uniref:hypothetical protein n=1 Tax=Massilia aurea TaxID=373040 RepID=UPI003462B583